MNFMQIDVYTKSEAVDVLVMRLSELGITGFVIHDSADFDEFLENKDANWDYVDDELMGLKTVPTHITLYLQDNPQGLETLTELKGALADFKAESPDFYGSLEIKIDNVKEEDWANNWKAYFKPIAVGEKLLVCPSWEEVPEGSTGAVLRIDPGMAFGSGTHHTTRMCLELLEKLISPDMRVADLGCGSGILSIAASLMGARETYAIDIDPVAAKVAGENAALNGIDMDKYFIRTGDILTDAEFKKDIAGEKFDIVMANIVANIIIAFAPVVPQLMKDGGMFIASGIIDDRLDEVTEALRENGLKIIEVREGEDWRALLAEKA